MVQKHRPSQKQLERILNRHVSARKSNIGAIGQNINVIDHVDYVSEYECYVGGTSSSNTCISYEIY